MSATRITLIPFLLLAGCAGQQQAGHNDAAMLRLGDRMRSGGDEASAAAFYAGAAEQNPRNAEARFRLAATQAAVGALSEAEASYRAGLALTPNSIDGRTGLAAVLLRRGDAAGAEAQLAPLAAGSQDVRLLRVHGVALDRLGRPTEAAAAYRRGLAVAPQDADLRGNLALSLALANDPAAVAEVRRVPSSPANEARYRRLLALVLLLAGDPAGPAEAQRLPPPEREEILQRVAAARAESDPARRAAAVGLVSGTTLPAPSSSAPPARVPPG
jgi:Flp pilus assembly protein TadD